MSNVDRNDLPLMANSKAIKIRHFILDLNCSIKLSKFLGSFYAILDTDFSCKNHVFDIQSHQHIYNKTDEVENENEFHKKKPEHGKNQYGKLKDNGLLGDDLKEPENHKCFTLILDCCDLNIISVSEIEIDNSKIECEVQDILDCKAARTQPSFLRKATGRSLEFTVEEWCIRIKKEGAGESHDFPRIVRIDYETSYNGRSLRWATDQSGHRCVYTAGMWVNNRALMPCQEYGCLSTWHAWITVPAEYTVLMSADFTFPVRIKEGMAEFGFMSSTPLPSFTLAIGVGRWSSVSSVPSTEPAEIKEKTCNHEPPCQIPFSQHDQIPWRLFAPECVLTRAANELSDYLPKCIAAAQHVLGPSPFPRLDIMVYPSCSQDMAMTNPNLIFLSQSVFAGDGSMCIKIAHELSHYWWGLLIGARDWTEEWLSEGFATFTEDLIHARVMQWSEEKLREHSEMRALLRHSVLLSELQNTQQVLQSLRPNRGMDQEDEDGRVTCVKDGMNPRKQFTQLHYLKGYFLLRFLAEKVGFWRFGAVLKEYIKRYHGHMVRSQDFIQLVFNELPELRDHGLSEELVYTDWLDSRHLPQYLKEFKASPTNKLFSTVTEELQVWSKFIASEKVKRKKRKRRKLSIDYEFKKITADQLVYLLEELVKKHSIPFSVLKYLHDTYSLHTANADVRHRWCELVVKHKYEKHYCDVEHFLIHDQAMGVYLYGELVISQCKKQRTLAERCFTQVQAEMEAGTRNTVHLMLYGEPYPL